MSVQLTPSAPFRGRTVDKKGKSVGGEAPSARSELAAGVGNCRVMRPQSLAKSPFLYGISPHCFELAEIFLFSFCLFLFIIFPIQNAFVSLPMLYNAL